MADPDNDGFDEYVKMVLERARSDAPSPSGTTSHSTRSRAPRAFRYAAGIVVLAAAATVAVVAVRSNDSTRHRITTIVPSATLPTVSSVAESSPPASSATSPTDISSVSTPSVGETATLAAFCSELSILDVERSESYIGSAEQIGDINGLIELAPQDVAADLAVIRDFLASGAIATADPESNVISNWPDQVQAAITTVNDYRTSNCPSDTASISTAAGTDGTPPVEDPAPLIPPVSDVHSGSIELPRGGLDLGPDDLFVVHVDGDLWVHPGALSEAHGAAFRLVDLEDPRVEVSEGPGPNTVDGVVGDVDGVVYYTDCCEPISGNLFVAAAENADGVRLGSGYSPVLSPDQTRLATANSYELTVIDLPTGSYEGRPLDNGGPFMNVWDLMWSGDGASLVILYFDDVGFGLMPVDARSPFEQGIPTSLGIAFDPSDDVDIHFAGRGPDGQIAVSIRDTTATLIRYFDAVTLTEIPEMRRSLPAEVTSVRLAADGVGLLWVDNTALWYLPADGDVRHLGSGYTAAWYAN